MLKISGTTHKIVVQSFIKSQLKRCASSNVNQNKKDNNSTGVLIIGGSLVGLSAAAFNGWRQIPTIVVEKHAGSSLHPRAIGFTSRTLEAYRSLGIASQIPQTPPNFRLRRARIESLAGQWFDESSWTEQQQQTPQQQSPKESAKKITDFSPYFGASLAQDRLEPILYQKAVEFGVDMRFNTELVSFEQNNVGVVANVKTRTGEKYKLNAKYMIAADGHRSPIREALGIGRSGRGNIRIIRSVLFRAPQCDQYLSKGVVQFNIDQPNFKAFLTTYHDGRWVLMFYDDIERDEATLKKMIVSAIGRSDFDIEIITTGRWELSAQITDKFASGRVFLAGDSAHTLPPTRGGYGANTGIDDVHNLSWKLQSVLNGQSRPELLSTYDAERRPIAWLRFQQMFARGDYKEYAPPTTTPVPIIDDFGIELGQLYRSESILGASEHLPPSQRPDLWEGQPGTRAPHIWLSETLSTLDLFHSEWIVLTENKQWRSVVTKASEALGVKVKCIVMGDDIKYQSASTANSFRKAYGLSKSGASLIRPDGYVAWRSVELPSASVDEVFFEALGKVSFSTHFKSK